MKLLLMADGKVGLEITRWLLNSYPEDIALIVLKSENEIWHASKEFAVPRIILESNEQICANVMQLDSEIDLGLLAWWPAIIKQPLLDIPRLGFINTHPSLLPHNRGKHYNFWALVEKAPFGVSLHMLDDGVDSGDIVAQRRIEYGWEDTAETLYARAQSEMITLFQDTYPALRKFEFRRTPQNLEQGSFHKAIELDSASEIKLANQYTAEHLLNLLRARTFTGYPACWFEDGGETFEVRVEIKRKGV